MGNLQKFMRGQVWWQRPSTVKQIGVQSDGRPVVIISNNACNRFSPAITVVPLTTAEKKPLPTHVRMLMEDGKVSTVLCEQLRTISTELIQNYVGTVDDTKMTEIDGAVLKALGFSPITIPEPVLPTPETSAIVYPEPPTITLNADPVGEDTDVPTSGEVADTDVGETAPKLRAKKFSKQEKKMIERYLGSHTIADTARYFAGIYNIEYPKMYTRINNVYHRMRTK